MRIEDFKLLNESFEPLTVVDPEAAEVIHIFVNEIEKFIMKYEAAVRLRDTKSQLFSKVFKMTDMEAQLVKDLIESSQLCEKALQDILKILPSIHILNPHVAKVFNCFEQLKSQIGNDNATSVQSTIPLENLSVDIQDEVFQFLTPLERQRFEKVISRSHAYDKYRENKQEQNYYNRAISQFFNRNDVRIHNRKNQNNPETNRQKFNKLYNQTYFNSMKYDEFKILLTAVHANDLSRFKETMSHLLFLKLDDKAHSDLYLFCKFANKLKQQVFLDEFFKHYFLALNQFFHEPILDSFKFGSALVPFALYCNQPNVLSFLLQNKEYIPTSEIAWLLSRAVDLRQKENIAQLVTVIQDIQLDMQEPFFDEGKYTLFSALIEHDEDDVILTLLPCAPQNRYFLSTVISSCASASKIELGCKIIQMSDFNDKLLLYKEFLFDFLIVNSSRKANIEGLKELLKAPLFKTNFKMTKEIATEILERMTEEEWNSSNKDRLDISALPLLQEEFPILIELALTRARKDQRSLVQQAFRSNQYKQALDFIKKNNLSFSIKTDLNQQERDDIQQFLLDLVRNEYMTAENIDDYLKLGCDLNWMGNVRGGRASLLFSFLLSRFYPSQQTLGLSKEDKDILLFLLAKGADADQQAQHQYVSPLNIAVSGKSFEVTALLMLHGARLDAQVKATLAQLNDKNFEQSILLFERYMQQLKTADSFLTFVKNQLQMLIPNKTSAPSINFLAHMRNKNAIEDANQVNDLFEHYLKEINHLLQPQSYSDSAIHNLNLTLQEVEKIVAKKKLDKTVHDGLKDLIKFLEIMRDKKLYCDEENNNNNHDNIRQAILAMVFIPPHPAPVFEKN